MVLVQVLRLQDKTFSCSLSRMDKLTNTVAAVILYMESTPVMSHQQPVSTGCPLSVLSLLPISHVSAVRSILVTAPGAG